MEGRYVDTLREVPVAHFALMMKRELVCDEQSVDGARRHIRDSGDGRARRQRRVLVAGRPDSEL
jgi:hypothetical protein